MGGMSFERIRPSYGPSRPLEVVRGAILGALGLEAGGGGGFSSTGESGGGGMLVPSVRLKFMGASAGSSKRPLGLPLLGIMKHWVGSLVGWIR